MIIICPIITIFPPSTDSNEDSGSEYIPESDSESSSCSENYPYLRVSQQEVASDDRNLSNSQLIIKWGLRACL